MNTDLNEKLKQYQRNYCAQKKLKNEIPTCFLQYKDEQTDHKICKYRSQ